MWAATRSSDGKQIFVHPNGSSIVQSILPLDFFDDIVDFHEVGHAYANMVDNVSVDSDESLKRALDFENSIRERRGLPSRRKTH